MKVSKTMFSCTSYSFKTFRRCLWLSLFILCTCLFRLGTYALLLLHFNFLFLMPGTKTS